MPESFKNWDDVRIFLTYLRNGTVAGAADELRISAPTVSRRITALQESLGFPLLNKSSQGLELAKTAQSLVEIWREAEQLLQHAPSLAARMETSQQVELRFSTTPAIATGLIFPHLRRYLDRWPNVILDVDTSIRLVDIGSGQGDVALRFVEPDRGAVLRQRIGTLSFNVYASEEVLPDGFVCAESWHDITELRLRAITWSPGASVSMPQQKLQKALGGQRSGISITEYSGLLDAVQNGIGVGILPDVVGKNLQGVRAVATSDMVGEMPLWLVTADRLAGYPHVSDFRKFVRQVVQEETSIDG